MLKIGMVYMQNKMVSTNHNYKIKKNSNNKLVLQQIVRACLDGRGSPHLLSSKFSTTFP